jgi:oligoribonuclease (3'-5' exoribonuclease)
MLAFDLETGGLDPTKTDLLTGYFAILDSDFKVLEELSLKLKPEGRLPIVEAKAMSTNGIDLQKHLEDPNTITYAEGGKRLTALVKKYLKKNGRYSNIIPMGYNIDSFDVPWAQHHLIDKDTWGSMIHYKCLDVSHDVDVLKRHGWLPPTCGTLSSMVEHFGVPKGEAHVAKDDIIMTVGVFLKLKELMESKKNGGSSQDLISLLESE